MAEVKTWSAGGIRAPGLVLLALGLALLACSRTDAPLDYGRITPVGGPGLSLTPDDTSMPPAAAATPSLAPATLPVPGLPTPTARPTVNPALSPTPDATRPSALDRRSVETYSVQRGDSLSQIGERYGVTAAEIADANGILVSDTLFVGQSLLIPLPGEQAAGPDLKLLPDSEVVYGPGAVRFDLAGFVRAQGGFLADYTEEVPGYFLDGTVDSAVLSGIEIVQLVAERYSLSPRLLLALLEHQSGWVSLPSPSDNSLAYPLRHVEVGREGLYRQLSWAARQVNFGYYAWRAGGLVSVIFSDGALRILAPGLNAGTVGVQYLFSQLLDVEEWQPAVSETGFLRTHTRLFGNRFAYAVDPLLPPGLTQPELQLPFEPGRTWAFTGGPHAAWDFGSAWAALDFAPPAEAEGCTLSDEWVVASAPGLIVRSEHGAVLQDLDGDGDEGTGWVLFYMHVEARDRVEVGAWLEAGQRIGHASCEGGISNGTHVHLARKYNGEWIPADSTLPFVLDGWVSAGLGREYDGLLLKDGTQVEAWNGRAALNEISRP